jgi:hypothetical protein
MEGHRKDVTGRHEDEAILFKTDLEDDMRGASREASEQGLQKAPRNHARASFTVVKILKCGLWSAVNAA